MCVPEVPVSLAKRVKFTLLKCTLWEGGDQFMRAYSMPCCLLLEPISLYEERWICRARERSNGARDVMNGKTLFDSSCLDSFCWGRMLVIVVYHWRLVNRKMNGA